MLELAVLGLLKERGMHGYELRKELGQKLGFFWTVSFGSLYPALRRLEKRGAVRQSLPREQASRRKQVYEITEAGEHEFIELLGDGASSAWEEEKFPLRLAFFRYLAPEMRLRLLERRKAYLVQRLEEGTRSLKRAKRGSEDSYTLSLMRHGVDVTKADIAWLEELIAAERRLLVDEAAAEAADAGAAEAETATAPDHRPDAADGAEGTEGPERGSSELQTS